MVKIKSKLLTSQDAQLSKLGTHVKGMRKDLVDDSISLQVHDFDIGISECTRTCPTPISSP
jgi:hypothetical protein